ncbi:hypothetical protein PORY_002067 [Pneumocystis oryctolagi]|uniref:Uncharacterized protein n=1 Tax=Pneumocystis oryctolagi TaxID=42067 RepID=A0ACB7CAC6_9ASCO|nr:hypothetical protein PORY_002067 [Pneumocystis oryctolagi]
MKTVDSKVSKHLICEDKTKQWPFYIVYSNLERRNLETNVFVSRVEAREIPFIIEFIYEHLAFDPLDLSYLKRIRKIEKNNEENKVEIILHSTKDLSLKELEEKAKKQLINIDIRIIQVPKYAPTKDLSLKELEEKAKKQLINIDIRIIQVPKYAPLTYEQFYRWNKLWPLHFRKNTLKQVEFQDESLSKLKTLMKYTWNLANENKEMKIAAIIVDSNFNIITTCVDSRISLKNPLKHAIINCITEVNQKQSSTISTSYLCKDLIVITTHEPCVMCSMALVHSRVFRIFYTINMPKTGGLESNYHIHGRNELNHRYQAFGNFVVENAYNTINEHIHT